MEFFKRDLNEESSLLDQGTLRCPFLRNINEPTNFSFSTPMAFPMPVKDRRGPIFEDGPNFDNAFRLFHGQNGVVPLSGRSFITTEESRFEPAPTHFNPLAAKAASISLSSFGFGGPFGFDAFSKKWNKINKKSKPSKKGGKSEHEAISEEWLQNGNCPIAKSYRAVGRVLPLVAKVLQPPPGMKFECPPAVIAARSAISKTAFAKNLRPQPLPAKILVIGALGMAVNIPIGMWREHTEKFSLAWFVAIHSSVPFIGMLRKSVLMPKRAMAFTIAASILGQTIGSRAERYRLKNIATETLVPDETSSSGPSPSPLGGDGFRSGHCSEIVHWEANPMQVTGPSSPSSECVC